jgi:5,6-dimethylbenzimidazole synthase
VVGSGWLPRLPINDLVYFEQWGDSDFGQNFPLTVELARMQADIQEKGIFPA